jgi:protein SCO1/2
MNRSQLHRSAFGLTFRAFPLATLLLLLWAAGPTAARESGEVWGADYFPNYELTAHTGEKLRFFDDVIAGKVVAVNFIFTSCKDVCPMETARMAEVQRILGDRVGEDVFFYSISIDPEHDTVEVLKEYAERFGVDGARWKFLTGDKAEIDRIRDSFGVYSTPVEEADLSNHNINLVIGNQSTGQWVRRSPFENPYILANQLGSWLHGWKKVSKHTKRDYANAPELRQISSGEMLFRDKCSSCHVISGGVTPARNARPLGPDLYGVHERRDAAWLRRWMAEPDLMLAEGDPIATALYEQYRVVMPNFSLEAREIESLLEYMARETERLRGLEAQGHDHAGHHHEANALGAKSAVVQ